MKNKFAIIILIIFISILIAWGLAWPFRISGDCMEPAIKDGQLTFLNRISPHLIKYRIDDIILFKHEEKVWISRIVALENNDIQIIEGGIIVNNAALQDGVARNWTNWKFGKYAIEKPITVPSGHVYVLSDNLSAHHDDSRVFGPIPNSSILGVIW